MKIYSELKLRQGFGLQKRLHELEQQFLAGQISRVEAVEKFKLEWESLLDLRQWCAENENDIRAAMLLSKLAGVAGNLSFAALSVPEQIEWRECGYLAAQRAELVHDEMGHGAQLAYLHFVTGNVAAAHKVLDDLLARNDRLLESPGDARLTGQTTVLRPPEERRMIRATLLSHRGMFLATTNRDEEALPVLSEAADIFRQNNPSALSHCLNTLAVVQDHLGQYAEALKTVNEAIHLDTPRRSAVALINRAGYLDSLGRADEALESLRQGERLAIEANDTNTIGLATVQLAYWFIRHGTEAEKSSAVSRLEEALDLFRATGDDRLRLKLLDTLASIYGEVDTNPTSTPEQKTEALHRLASVQEQLGLVEDEVATLKKYAASDPEDQETQLESSIRLGHAFVKLKLPDQAIEHHQTAINIFSELKLSSPGKSYAKAELELYLSLGQAQRAKGQPEAAIETYQRAQALAEQTADEEAAWRARGNLALAQVDCGQFEAALRGLKEVADYYGASQSSGGSPDLRLLGHARFNIAYAHHRQGQTEVARPLATEALRLLSLVNDQAGIKQIKEQMATW